jgi:hypothetical protein
MRLTRLQSRVLGFAVITGIVTFGMVRVLQGPFSPRLMPGLWGARSPDDVLALTTIVQYEGATTRLSPSLGREAQRNALASLIMSSRKITESDLDMIWSAVARGDLCDPELRALTTRLLDAHRGAFLANYDADRTSLSQRLNTDCFNALAAWAEEARHVEAERQPVPTPSAGDILNGHEPKKF